MRDGKKSEARALFLPSLSHSGQPILPAKSVVPSSSESPSCCHAFSRITNICPAQSATSTVADTSSHPRPIAGMIACKGRRSNATISSHRRTVQAQAKPAQTRRCMVTPTELESRKNHSTRRTLPQVNRWWIWGPLASNSLLITILSVTCILTWTRWRSMSRPLIIRRQRWKHSSSWSQNHRDSRRDMRSGSGKAQHLLHRSNSCTAGTEEANPEAKQES